MTDAERKLWSRIKDIPLPRSHFRRQAPVGPFFADFVCHDAKLVVEIDGEQHAFPANAAKDVERTRQLASHGYRVLRFWNHEVFGEIEAVLDTIYAALTDPNFDCESLRRFPPTPNPSPPQAGGGDC